MQARKELQEARNLDTTGAKRLIGTNVVDRDGREWTIQYIHKGPPIRYDITPVRKPEYGDMGYIVRRLTDDAIDARQFGFKKGTQIRHINGEFVHVETDFS